MEEIMNIVCNSESKELSIVYGDQVMDVSRICNMPIEQWLFPFCANGTRWRGLYAELVEFCGKQEFSLRFQGDETSFERIKFALADKPVKVIAPNNIVTIVYAENPFVTKITVNGKVFNTMMIQNRCIEEWVNPIQIRDFNWEGIYNELTKFIGVDTYTVYFVGDQELMNVLCEYCPQTVSVFYKEPRMFKNSLGARENKNAESVINTERLVENTKNIISNIKETVEDNALVEKGKNMEIKNPFLRQHLVVILMALSVVELFLPFMSISTSAKAAGVAVKGPSLILTGFNVIFGMEQGLVAIKGSAFAFLLLIVPIVVIVANYVKPLEQIRPWIVRFAPLVGILGEILSLLHLKGIYKASVSAPGVEAKMSVAIGIGLILIAIVYLISAAVGFVLYSKNESKNFEEK